MISLKQILFEISEDESKRLLDKIKNKDYTFFARGDNGKVYSLNNEDLLFKITNEPSEVDVANVIVGRAGEFSSFIPIHYTNQKNMYIMSKASPLNNVYKQQFNNFINRFKQYQRETGGEVNIFDFLDNDGGRETDYKVVSFLRSLQQDIRKIQIEGLAEDLDFKLDNIMMYNGNLVMIDW